MRLLVVASSTSSIVHFVLFILNFISILLFWFISKTIIIISALHTINWQFASSRNKHTRQTFPAKIKTQRHHTTQHKKCNFHRSAFQNNKPYFCMLLHNNIFLLFTLSNFCPYVSSFVETLSSNYSYYLCRSNIHFESSFILIFYIYFISFYF